MSRPLSSVKGCLCCAADIKSNPKTLERGKRQGRVKGFISSFIYSDLRFSHKLNFYIQQFAKLFMGGKLGAERFAEEVVDV